MIDETVKQMRRQRMPKDKAEAKALTRTLTLTLAPTLTRRMARVEYVCGPTLQLLQAYLVRVALLYIDRGLGWSACACACACARTCDMRGPTLQLLRAYKPQCTCD